MYLGKCSISLFNKTNAENLFQKYFGIEKTLLLSNQSSKHVKSTPLVMLQVLMSCSYLIQSHFTFLKVEKMPKYGHSC